MRLGSLMLSRSGLGRSVCGQISGSLMLFWLLLAIWSAPSTAAGFKLFGPNLDAVKDLLADPY